MKTCSFRKFTKKKLIAIAIQLYSINSKGTTVKPDGYIYCLRGARLDLLFFVVNVFSKR